MKIAVYTNPYDFKFETEIINRLFREGLDELHVRKPDYTKEQYKEFIEKIDKEYHPKLVLHSYFGLIHTYNVLGIFLDSDWRRKFIFKFFLNKFILRGKSIKKYALTNSFKEIGAFHKEVNEFLLGPVFAKATSHINNPIMDLSKLENRLNRTKINVSAIGGVGLDNIQFFKNIGFGGVVLQSAIWKTTDPIKAFITIRDFKKVKEHKLKIVS